MQTKSPSLNRRICFVREPFIYALVLAESLVCNDLAWAEYGDVIINNYSDAQNIRPVASPHWFHPIRFTCKVCPTGLDFKFKAGISDINRVKIVEGQYCGA